ncbi:MAG TPA: hypothetical protein VEI97_18530 [bacterium]|nr:hypothetical protein [bacterium]
MRSTKSSDVDHSGSTKSAGPPEGNEDVTLGERILAALKAEGKPVKVSQLRSALGGSYDSLRSTLSTLKGRGLIVHPPDPKNPTKPWQGHYVLPPNGDNRESLDAYLRRHGIDPTKAGGYQGLAVKGEAVVSEWYDEAGLSHAIRVQLLAREPRRLQHRTQVGSLSSGDSGSTPTS